MFAALPSITALAFVRRLYYPRRYRGVGVTVARFILTIFVGSLSDDRQNSVVRD
jgi:hypothetical protein